jgi:hypothetical protein
MNERIRELAIQSGLPTALDYHQKRYEKFAELIVKACADAADMAQDANCEYAGDYVAEYMGYGQEQGVTKWRAE